MLFVRRVVCVLLLADVWLLCVVVGMGCLFVVLLSFGCWLLCIVCRLTMMCVVVVCRVANGWCVV